MTPAQAKKLAAAVAERSARAGPWPSPEARLALHALLVRFAAGESVPAQDVFARELGLTERRLRAALQELRDRGLVMWVSASGRAPAVYDVQDARVRAWVDGALSFDGPVSGVEIDPTTADSGDEIDPTNSDSGAVFDPTTSRARSKGGGGADPVAAAVAPERELEATVKAAVAELRKGGVRCPFTVQRQVREWVVKGLTVDDFAIAAEEAGNQGTAAWAYANRVLERLHGEATGGRVSHISDYRVIHPWGAGGAS